MKKSLAMRLIKLAHCLSTILLFVFVWNRFYLRGSFVIAHPKGIYLGYVLYIICVLWLLRVFHAYHLGYYDILELYISQAIADVLASGALYILTSFIYMRLVNPLPFLLLLVLQQIVNVVWLLIANKVYFRVFGHQKAVIIYCEPEDLQTIDHLGFIDSKFEFVHKIQMPVSEEKLWQQIKTVQVVIIAGLPISQRNELIEKCYAHKIRVLMMPEVSDLLIQRATHMQCFHTPVMSVSCVELTPEYAIIKRTFDMCASLCALIVLSPILLITALAIKIQDGGPVFYSQTRLTKDGKEFCILKFRSMVVNAEREGCAQLAAQNDNRITRVGRFIRACRIDELPQLINILAGDMSIVGPRPERPEIAAEYEKELPAFKLRLQVKAGLTGYAQVVGKYNSTPKEKLIMDLLYINRMDVVTDLKVILRTVRILFQKESTEGVDVGQVTAMDYENEAERAKSYEKAGDK